MMKDGFTPKEIEDFFAAAPIRTDEGNNNNKDYSKFSGDPRYGPIIKLRNMRVPEIALRHKMATEGFTQLEIDDFWAPV